MGAMEAKTLHCQSCGAAVGEHDLKCPYCGSQLATLACPRCFALVPLTASHCPRCGAAIQRAEAQDTALACPGCRGKLAATSVGGVSLDQCHACGGVWIGQHNFEHLAADRAERGEVLGTLPGAAPQAPGPAPVGEVHYRPCPQCGKLMNRTNYAHISGVILDVCRDHGLWFDRDKLRLVLEFVEGGGLDKSRARQAAEEDEHRRQLASGAALDQAAWNPPVENRPGEWILSALGDLFHLVR